MNRLWQSLFDGSRVIRACGYSMQGLRAAYRNESAFRQELILAAILVPAGAWLGRSPAERALLIGSVLLVLVVELLNSAVEAAVDYTGKARHPLAGRAKDTGSAAVLVTMLIVVFTWALVLGDRFAG